jgi:hypothetical protein
MSRNSIVIKVPDMLFVDFLPHIKLLKPKTYLMYHQL